MIYPERYLRIDKANSPLTKSLENILNRASIRYHQVTVPAEWKQFLPLDDLIILKRLGMRPIEVLNLPVESLFLQHHVDRPIDFLLKKEDGHIDRSIVNSPHFSLLKMVEERGVEWLKENYRSTGYYRIYEFYNRIGRKKNLYKKEGWIPVKHEDVDILRKMVGFVEMYWRVRKDGYLGGPFRKNRISVLEVPFSVGRFGAQIEWRPYEIWGGHHRAAAFAAAGADRIEAVLIKDTRAHYAPAPQSLMEN